jgi:hypothetical protein
VARAQGAVLLVLPPRRCTYSEQRKRLVISSPGAPSAARKDRLPCRLRRPVAPKKTSRRLST